MNSGRAALEMLRGYRVTDIFGLPGETTLSLYRAWKDYPDIHYHLCRDERSSVFMADAYAKSSGKVGVCEGPSVGCTHMIPGVTEAFQSCVPLICITSDIPLKFGTNNMLTGCDQTALFKSITKDSYTVNRPEELPHLFRRAFRTATTGRPGPVHIRIPSDIFDSEVPDSEVYAQPRYATFPGCRSTAAQEDIAMAADLIAKAECPVMICGQGVVHSGAWREVQSISEKQNMPMGSSINAKGAIPENHPLSLGVIGARGGRKWGNDIIMDADLVLFVGSSTDSASTDSWSIPNPKSGQVFIQIDTSERELGNNYNALPLFGDARETLRGLISALDNKKTPCRKDWVARVARERAVHEKKLQALMTMEGDNIHPLSLVRTIEKIVPDNAFFAVDPGTSAVYSAGFMRLEKAGRRTAYNFSMGALGYAIPAAIGARFGVSQNTPVIGLVGDGSFGFCAGELETAARLGLKIIYILFNNQTFGWIRGTEYVQTGEKLTPWYSQFTDFSNVDYVKFAESLGFKGFRADKLSDFKRIFTKCLAEDSPCLIDVPVTPEDRQIPPVPGWTGSGTADPDEMIY
ncbi:MAG: thiamine pyrophosphate-binding protein [Synergistaceae bacterium]|nr:thiamine pyrophosphate-binding protein [Synergistaceae bacterium]